MILILDNYDSFTYNLAHMLYTLNLSVLVKRNREISVQEVIKMRPDAIVLSPGPGRPEKAGIMLDLIHAVRDHIPLLGICLGHQAIAQSYGAAITNASRIMHGKVSQITHDGRGLFKGIKREFKAVRYHSLAVKEETLPEELEVSARSEDNEIMGLRHKKLLIEGLQYHPESILTATGKMQMENFISEVEARQRKGGSHA
ncbi:MAG TPA: aminodeoxychorismate/anthranilate synthase component II [Verrucomicrobiota bacterium]|jgi:anthranilate synthase/aminodeoxychorismate synthase-like glutamine amidotransferase|nr:aminodeoxychorismate/anthranilate synthase component II [Verrucomicrobiota bacterium]